MKAIACPSCAAPMERHKFSRKPQGGVDLDLCFACHAIWFDQYESAQLTAGAVLDLFGQIHAHHDQPPRPLGDALRCPACRERLQLTQDIQRTNRISYYRCAAAHGRLTTFFQFLREKQFVRSLTAAEVARLKAHVAQVRCSGCGAPVNVERDAQCGYCRSPISILDPDAVKRTLAELGRAERKPVRVDPDRIVEGMLSGQRFEEPRARFDSRAAAPAGWAVASGGLVDLVGEALGFLMSD